MRGLPFAILDWLSWGAIGEANLALRGPVVDAERLGSDLRSLQKPMVAVRGAVKTVGQPGTEQSAVVSCRSLVFRSLERYRSLRGGFVMLLSWIAIGTLAGAGVAAVVCGLVQGLFGLFGIGKYASIAVIALTAAWFAFVLYERFFFQDSRVTLAGRSEEYFKLGRMKAVADPKSSGFLFFLLATVTGSNAALLYLVPELYFESIDQLSLWQSITAALDNASCGILGWLVNTVGWNTGYTEARAGVTTWGLAIFFAYRYLGTGLLAVFLGWWFHHIWTATKMFEDFPPDETGVTNWIRGLARKRRFLHLFSNELMFLVVACNIIERQPGPAGVIVGHFGGIAVDEKAWEKLLHSKTD